MGKRKREGCAGCAKGKERLRRMQRMDGEWGKLIGGGTLGTGREQERRVVAERDREGKTGKGENKDGENERGEEGRNKWCS